MSKNYYPELAKNYSVFLKSVNWMNRYNPCNDCDSTQKYDTAKGTVVTKAPTKAKPDINDRRTLNSYMYAGNNPVMNIDPNGEFFFEILTYLGGVIGGLAQGIDAMLHGRDFWKGFQNGWIDGVKIGGTIGLIINTYIPGAQASYTSLMGMAAMSTYYGAMKNDEMRIGFSYEIGFDGPRGSSNEPLDPGPPVIPGNPGGYVPLEYGMGGGSEAESMLLTNYLQMYEYNKGHLGQNKAISLFNRDMNRSFDPYSVDIYGSIYSNRDKFDPNKNGLTNKVYRPLAMGSYNGAAYGLNKTIFNPRFQIGLMGYNRGALYVPKLWPTLPYTYALEGFVSIFPPGAEIPYW